MIGRCPSKLHAGQRALPAVQAAGLTQRCVTKRAPAARSVVASPAPTIGAAAHRARRVHCAVVAGPAVASKPQAPEEEKVKVDSVKAHEVAPGLHLIRGACNSRLKFEVEYNLRRGTTDNCYVLQAPGASVLVDIPFEAYGEQFVSVLKSLTPLKDLTHIVLTQLDPKNIPSLEAVLRAMVAEAGPGKQVQVVVSNPAARLLQSVLGDKPEKADLLSAMQVVVARSELKVPIGSGGRELELLLLPTPRWPDMMMAYDSANRMIFSSKLFSAHVSPSVAETNVEAVGSADSALDVGGWDAYGSDWRHFFECMVAPQARQALPALDKLDLMAVPVIGTVATGPADQARATDFGTELGLWLYRLVTGKKPSSPAPAQPGAAAVAAATTAAAAAASSGGGRAVSYVLPMHGPVVSNALAQLVREYRSWTEAQVEAASTSCAVVLYASAYGNTAALAQAISRGITKAGVAVDMLNLETENLDSVTKAIASGNGFIIGSPTLGGHMPTQVQVTLGAIIREANAKGMPCGVFGSFGWSGEAVDEMEQKLRDAGFGFAFDAIRVKFRPTAKDLQLCEESGRELALAIKRKIKAKEASESAGNCLKQATASAPTLAMGRVVGSLSVLTAKDDDASTAMLASWVSQASFNPPGLTVSIKKDRAMESMLIVGGKFAMSTVPEGRDKLVMKKLARPFAPGEDRLAGLETFPGEITGAPVLKDANAVLECQVSSRMEAGDHWLVYATVIGGKVLDDGAPTAVHHRKVGNHY